MRVPQERIERAVADKDDPRPYLRHVHYDAENQELVATSGTILAIVPLLNPDADDKGGPIPTRAIKASRKTSSERIDVSGSRAVVVDNDVSYDRGSKDGTFPSYKKLIPPADSTPEVCVSAKLLLQLAKAIGNRDVSDSFFIGLSFQRRDDGQIDPFAPVHVHTQTGGRGTIMPAKIAEWFDSPLSGESQ